MPITALPTPPTRDDPSNFAQRADDFLAALPAFATETNAVAAEVEADREAVDAQTALVLPAASAALGAANYKGVWSMMSGAVAVPASVYHAGRFWIALEAMANVATETPGVSSKWAPLVDDVGVLGFFATTTAPAGWLKANGASVSRTAYAALFARIGTTYGNGNGSSTFNLPDMRGEFVRGLDDGRGVDSGRSLGSAQSSQNLSHTHTGTTGNQSADHTHSGTTSTAGGHTHGLSGGAGGVVQILPTQSGSVAGIGSGAAAGNYAYQYNGVDIIQTAGNHAHTLTTGGASANHTHSFTTASSGGSEARPRNVAWLACIRF